MPMLEKEEAANVRGARDTKDNAERALGEKDTQAERRAMPMLYQHTTAETALEICVQTALEVCVQSAETALG